MQYVMEFCAGQVDPRGLRKCGYPHLRDGCGNLDCYTGRVRVEHAAGRERVALGGGAGRARDEKFFVRITEC